jgi:NAD(P)-dependent dehydrogenase (short-subunit alcohol dehydrogenase family)
MRLKDKVCIVTGGGSGIGRATALLFADEGARLVVADKRNPQAVAAECAGKGAQAIAVEADVALAGDVERMIAATVGRFRRLDILVNNAGYGIAGTVVETPQEAWDALMATNVRGVFLCSKYAIPVMKRNGGGTIVNTASVVAAVGIANRAAYCASKGAVAALTRAMLSITSATVSAVTRSRRERSTRRISMRSSRKAPIAKPRARRWLRGSCSDGSAQPRRSRPASCFSPATKAVLPPARFSPWTAA